jgi:nucleoside-diphosphate-sugar epimerase
MILLTGSTGFLGRHVLRTLLRHNWIVRPLVRNEERYRAHFPGGPGPVSGDFCQFKRGDLATERIGELIHIASEVWPVQRQDERDFARVNVAGARALLESIDARPLKAIVLASTTAVYGAATGRIDESRPPAPAGAYAASKLEQERIFTEYGKRHGVPVAILRLSSLYGPGQHPSTVLPKFLQLAREHRTITITGPPERVQNFLYVDDAARAMACAIEHRASSIYNIGGPAEVSLRELANTVLRVTGARARAIERPSPDERPAARFHLDISKAARELGWEPRYNLEDGLRETLAATS